MPNILQKNSAIDENEIRSVALTLFSSTKGYPSKVLICTPEGYLFSVVEIPDEYLEWNEAGSCFKNRQDVKNWFEETIRKNTDAFWAEWDKNNNAGDRPVKFMGKWYPGTKEEVTALRWGFFSVLVSLACIIAGNFITLPEDLVIATNILLFIQIASMSYYLAIRLFKGYKRETIE